MTNGEFDGKYCDTPCLILDSLTVVKLTRGWAEKAVYKDEVRYRKHYYKIDAQLNLNEWNIKQDMSRNFYHNFWTAEYLGIKEVSHD